MADVITQGLSTAFVLVLVMGASFWLSYRRSIVGLIDPLFLNGTLVVFYLAGLGAFLSAQDGLPHSVPWITAGILGAFFLPGLIMRQPMVERGVLSVQRPALTIALRLIAVLLLINLLANYVFGVIPLISGTESRSEQGGTLIPTLVLISPQLGTVAIGILALDPKRRSKLAGRVCVLLWAVTVLLSGAKSAVIQLLIGYLFYVYLSRYRRAAAPVSKAAKPNRRRVLWMLATAALLAPLYFLFVVASEGTSEAAGLFIYRLFSGFDIVVYTIINEIDIASAPGAGVAGFYLYPILKAVGLTPEYQSAGQYVSAQVFGYANSLESLNPNSNLVVEWIMSFGNVAGTIGAVTLVLFAFGVRIRLLTKSKMGLLEVFLMPQFVMAPFGLLLDGSLFFLTLLWTLVLYVIVNTITNLVTPSNLPVGRYQFH